MTLSSVSVQAPKIPLPQASQSKAGLLHSETPLMEIPSVSAAFSKESEPAKDTLLDLREISVPSLVKGPKDKTLPSPLAQTRSPEKPKIEELRGLKKYQAHIAENTLRDPRPLIIPTRRICKFGGQESGLTKLIVMEAIFIQPDEIVQVHQMRFLRNSPFVHPLDEDSIKYLSTFDTDHQIWSEILSILIKEIEAIAITEDGKHVILQQTAKSCVPTCVAMLVLDHGKTPDFDAIANTYLANSTRAKEWVEKAGLKPRLTEFSGAKNIRDDLIKCLSEHGPGVLTVNHPGVGGHVIVLDEISTTTNTAKIRDSFHGWSLTIKLDVLLSWINPDDSYFLQIVPS